MAVLKQDPKHTAAGVNLSWLLLQKGANEAALGVAQRVIDVDPCDDKAWTNLAQASSRLGDKVSALSAARRAAKIDPYNPGYWMGLGEAMLSSGNRDGARVYFERTLKRQPGTWQAHARLGQIALESGDYLRASTHHRKPSRLAQDRVELIGMLGLSRWGEGTERVHRRCSRLLFVLECEGPRSLHSPRRCPPQAANRDGARPREQEIADRTRSCPTRTCRVSW